MSHSAIDITRQQDRPLKGRAALRRKPALCHASRRPMREPEIVAISEVLREDLNNRIRESLAGKLSHKTVGDIIAEELGEAYR